MSLRKVIGYLILAMVCLTPLIVGSIAYSFKEALILYLAAIAIMIIAWFAVELVTS